MKKIIVDGKDAIFGRIGSYIAKELLKGNSVFLINCEEIIISGKKELIIEKIKRKLRMGRGGSLKGPKYIRRADFLVKRMMRGMLPWDKPRGRNAYKKLRCYVGLGDLNETDLKNVIVLKYKTPLKYVKIKEIVSLLK